MCISSMPVNKIRAQLNFLESEHRPNPAFDCSVVLLDDVIQILSLTDPDRWFTLDVDRFQRSQISSALIDRHCFRHAIMDHGLFEITLRRVFVASDTKQEVNGVAVPTHSAIQILPLSFDFDIGLVHAPAFPHRGSATAKYLLQNRQ